MLELTLRSQTCEAVSKAQEYLSNIFKNRLTFEKDARKLANVKTKTKQKKPAKNKYWNRPHGISFPPDVLASAQAHSQSHGETLSGFVVRAISAMMTREAKNNTK